MKLAVALLSVLALNVYSSSIPLKGVKLNFWQGISVTDESGQDFEVVPVGPGEIEILPTQPEISLPPVPGNILAPNHARESRSNTST